jgi:hypothetical protein
MFPFTSIIFIFYYIHDHGFLYYHEIMFNLLQEMVYNPLGEIDDFSLVAHCFA